MTGFVRLALLKDLFGVKTLTYLTVESMNSLQLSRHLGLPLTQKKIFSFSKKYFSILADYLDYYPSIEGMVIPKEEPASVDSRVDSIAIAPTTTKVTKLLKMLWGNSLTIVLSLVRQ